MATYYSVIRFVPRPIAEEFINIGVIVFDHTGRVEVRFTDRYDRLSAFTDDPADLAFIPELQERYKEAAKAGLLFPGDNPAESTPRDRMAAIANSWCINCIQFSEPRGAIDSVDGLLSYVTRTYL